VPSLKTGTCALAALLAFAALAESDVRISIGPDGRKVIYNETPTQQARRTSAKLLPIPDAQLVPLIERHSRLQNLDSRLVRAVIQAESGYNQRALSNKGAIGLMQLMPGTANQLRVDPWNTEENLRGGTTYLRQLLDRFQGRLEWAVAAYNAGPGAVERHRGIPPYRETKEYVRRVLSLYQGDTALRVLPRVTTAAPGGTRTIATASAAAPPPADIRRKTRIIRNSDNQIVLTTALE
jgi:soluble lytic murein transglycosylase-like protein